MTRTRKTLAAITAAFALALLLTGCSDKFNEPFKDAPRGTSNNGPADIGTMPDGFSNWASKCDGPNRVYTAYHGDATYAAIAVVANDPRCR
jgi:hypothetical protein